MCAEAWPGNCSPFFCKHKNTAPARLLGKHGCVWEQVWDAGGAPVGMRRGKGGTRSTAPAPSEQPGRQSSTFSLHKLFRSQSFWHLDFTLTLCTIFSTVRSGSRPFFHIFNFFFYVLVNIMFFLFCSGGKPRPSEGTGIPRGYS